MNKKKLYESIMTTIAKEVKKVLNEKYKTIRGAEDLEDLYDKTLRKYRIYDGEFEDLMYIVHSDKHVYSEDLKYLIEKLQKRKGEIPVMHLYRGCSDEEFNKINKTGFSPVPTLSFSENKNLANHFGNNIIEIISEVPLFCYHKFLGEYFTSMKKVDPEEFEAEDGEYMIETAETELEWICTNSYKFEQTDKPNIFILKMGPIIPKPKIQYTIF